MLETSVIIIFSLTVCPLFGRLRLPHRTLIDTLDHSLAATLRKTHFNLQRQRLTSQLTVNRAERKSLSHPNRGMHRRCDQASVEACVSRTADVRWPQTSTL